MINIGPDDEFITINDLAALIGEMLAFFDYCERNWQDTEKDKAKADQALKLFAQAQAKADATSIYGRRLALIDDYLKGLRSKSQQLGRKRGPVPKLRLVGEAQGPIVIDGKLDEDTWTQCPTAATGRLRELQTGRQPIFGTTFKAYRAEVLKDINLYGELHRFIPALASWSGATVVEVPVRLSPRESGTSKYGLGRTIRVLLDLLSIKFMLDYSTKPLHFFGLFGLLGTGMGAFFPMRVPSAIHARQWVTLPSLPDRT